MSRRKRSRKKDFVGDPKYNDILVARFSNYVMRRGKKSVAEALLYESFDIIEEKTGQRGIEVFKKALSTAKTYGPITISPEQQSRYPAHARECRLECGHVHLPTVENTQEVRNRTRNAQ